MKFQNILGILLLFFAHELYANVLCQKAVLGQNRVIVISGTTRDGANTYKLSQIIAQRLSDSVSDDPSSQVQLIDLLSWREQEARELVEWMDGDRSQPRPDYWNTSETFKSEFELPIALADTVVIVHPEYNKGINGELKTFLDRLSIDSFKHHQIYTIALSDGPRGGLVPDEQLHSTLAKRGAAYSEDNRHGISGIGRYFTSENGDALATPQVADRTAEFIDQIAESL